MRTVLISGAAGGIGTATVKRFLDCGYRVCGLDIDPAVESATWPAYRGAIADVRSPEQVQGAIDSLLEGLELAHVVGLAGRALPEERGLLLQDPTDAAVAFNASVELNLTGQFNLVMGALPRLREADGDRSITFCSTINALGGFGAPAYSSGKAGLIGLMHALVTPLGPAGIRVNVVAPGTIETPLLMEELNPRQARNLLHRLRSIVPLRRSGMPDDVAALIEALADRMTYVTDEVVRVDGGRLLNRDPSELIRVRERIRHRLRHPRGGRRRSRT
jgi:meso-butanediol dehydrogenase/(S,S)-butanediol dehydrogenase/diacetyl reductase